MDQDKQTLLEAAKAFSADVGLSDWMSMAAVNLRTAIAREEARKGPAAEFLDRLARTEDRAQQAEADAKWHREESARLSEDLRTARELLAYSKCAWQERAEKAEAELAEAKQARQLDRAVDVLTKIEPRDPTTGWTFATYRRVVEALGGKS